MSDSSAFAHTVPVPFGQAMPPMPHARSVISWQVEEASSTQTSPSLHFVISGFVHTLLSAQATPPLPQGNAILSMHLFVVRSKQGPLLQIVWLSSKAQMALGSSQRFPP